MRKDDIDLINDWIIESFICLQRQYDNFFLLRNNHLSVQPKISDITNRLTDFVENNVSKEYLELVKVFPNIDERTKKVLLFIYQQLLVMLHPIIPFLTNFSYKKVCGEDISQNSLFIIKENKIKKDGLWQVDCCLKLIKEIRVLKKKVGENSCFFFQIFPEFKKKYLDFDWSFFVDKICKSKLCFFDNESFNPEAMFSVPIFPFGVILYNESENNKKDLAFYEFELNRCKKLLSNVFFLQKANLDVVNKEKKKKEYYEEQVKKIREKNEKK